jgi:hypothetical protein
MKKTIKVNKEVEKEIVICDECHSMCDKYISMFQYFTFKLGGVLGFIYRILIGDIKFKNSILKTEKYEYHLCPCCSSKILKRFKQ